MEAEKTLQFLAQLRPSNTTAQSLYSPESNKNRNPGQQVILRKIYIANTSNKSVDFSVFFDNSGSTYDESTALFFELRLPKHTTELIELDIPMRSSDGNLGVQIGTADDITFTLYGEK